MYYRENLDNGSEVQQPETKKADEYCKSIGQSMENTFFVRNYNNKHHTS